MRVPLSQLNFQQRPKTTPFRKKLTDIDAKVIGRSKKSKKAPPTVLFKTCRYQRRICSVRTYIVVVKQPPNSKCSQRVTRVQL